MNAIHRFIENNPITDRLGDPSKIFDALCDRYCCITYNYEFLIYRNYVHHVFTIFRIISIEKINREREEFVVIKS